MGPAYATKRQEALSSMLEITKMNPQLMAVIGDLIVKHMDWPGAQEIVERIRKTMDPKLLDENVAQIPPQVQAQMMQMGQLIQQLQLANSEIQQKLDAKVLDIQSKERMKAAELETDLIKEQMKMPTELAMVQFQEQLAQLQQWQDQVTQLFNGAGHISAAPPIQEQQQPTGGMPGSYME
jgi:RNAse (barnase) inhibitor barstar